MSTSSESKAGAIIGGIFGVVFAAGVIYTAYYLVSRLIVPAVKTGAEYVGSRIDAAKLRSAIVGTWSSRKGIELRTYSFLSDNTVTAMLPGTLGQEKWAGTFEITSAGKIILHLTAVRDATRRIDSELPCELDSGILRIGDLFFTRAAQ